MTAWIRGIAGVGLVACLGGAIWSGSRPGWTTLAGFSTDLRERTQNQRHNATLAASKIRLIEVAPGATFSFNETVGSFSRDRGFRRAPVSYNGQLIKGWGGGVCQTSTTLYNAALLAGLEIVDRSKHRFSPSYAPPGRDSAVAFGNIDLKVRNPYAFPIRIQASATTQQLKVEILGAGRPNELPKVVSEIRGVESPATLALWEGGQTGRVRNSGKQGFSVDVVRVWRDRRERISRDHYPVMHRVVEYD